MSPSRVFISYSHHDKRYLEELLTHLAPLQHEGKVDVWADTRLRAGDNWREEIRQALASAKVAIVLVSAHFRASKFIAEHELPPLLSAAKQQGVFIIPVVVGGCDFQDSELAYVQAANEPSRPLSALSPHKRDAVWVGVARRVRQALTDDEGQAPVAAATAPSEPSLPQPSGSADELAARGKALVEQMRYAEAVPLLKHAAQLAPDNYDAWFNLGLAYHMLNERQQALSAWDAALRLHPGDVAGWNNKAAALIDLKQYTEALFAIDWALTHSPAFSPAWNNKATALNGLKRYTEALDACERELALFQRDAVAWANKGYALAGLKRYAEALTAYGQALALEPKNLGVWTNQGTALSAMGRYQEAITDYERGFPWRSSSASEFDAEDFQGLIRALRALGRTAEAQEAERRAKELGG